MVFSLQREGSSVRKNSMIRTKLKKSAFFRPQVQVRMPAFTRYKGSFPGNVIEFKMAVLFNLESVIEAILGYPNA